MVCVVYMDTVGRVEFWPFFPFITLCCASRAGTPNVVVVSVALVVHEEEESMPLLLPLGIAVEETVMTCLDLPRVPHFHYSS
jgi:hypothetical protein